MERGKGRSLWWSGLGLPLCLLSGCVLSNSHINPSLLAENAQARNLEITEGYVARCPDVLQVAVEGRSDLGESEKPIGPDGRIDLGAAGRIRVEGLNKGKIAERVAVASEAAPADVRVTVADYRSQQIYIFGQVNGLQRVVPYKGEETVLDLLHRAGGIAPGAEPDQVYVVRPHVADGKNPEIFPVKLEAIVMEKDQRTNLRLEPFDQVYIGETNRSSFEKIVPPWFRPFYDKLLGMPVKRLRDRNKPDPASVAKREDERLPPPRD